MNAHSGDLARSIDKFAMLGGVRPNFLEPGGDGDLDPSVNIWKKGIVFLDRRQTSGPTAGYRISASFKRGVSPDRPIDGFRGMYRRVTLAATQRVSELVAAGESLKNKSSIDCHGWWLLGDGGRPATLDTGGKLATAFVTLSLPEADGQSAARGEAEPTDEELAVPGGTSLDALLRAQPQRVAEGYNEFDFSNSPEDLITVSYGESIAPRGDDGFDFAPFVGNAERFAESYHSRLVALGEAATPLRIVRREWFFADPRLVTVQLCFPR